MLKHLLLAVALLPVGANSGPGSLLKPNALWTQDGLMYAFPFR